MDYITALVTLFVVFAIPAAIVSGLVAQRPRAGQRSTPIEAAEPTNQHSA